MKDPNYWINLEVLEGTWHEIYKLRLSCPIRELTVRSFLGCDENTDHILVNTDAFLDVVRTASPSALSFGVAPHTMDEAIYRAVVDRAPRLKFLRFTFTQWSLDFIPDQLVSFPWCICVYIRSN